MYLWSSCILVIETGKQKFVFLQIYDQGWPRVGLKPIHLFVHSWTS